MPISEFYNRDKEKYRREASEYYLKNREEQRKKSRERYRLKHPKKQVAPEEMLKKQVEQGSRDKEHCRRYYYSPEGYEKRKRYRQEYYLKNREKLRENRRLAYHNDPVLRERSRIALKLWQRENKRTGRYITKEVIEAVVARNIQQYGCLTCYLCLGEIEGRANLEHRVPRFRGGSNEESNLDMAHWLCNRKKGSMTYEEYKETNDYRKFHKM